MIERALVTGATGFLGGNLVEALRRRGVVVRALVRKANAPFPRDVEIAVSDVTCDDDALARATEGCDVVFHCAGAVGDRLTFEKARPVNVDGTRHVARAARRSGVRTFVHVSSVAVYGFDAGTYDEQSPTRRVGEPYIDTKSEGEEVCVVELGDGPTLRILRPSIVYGPGDTGMLPRLIELLQNRVPMIGDGGAPVALVHVNDVVDAMLAAASYAGEQRIFNVAGSEDVTWAELVELLRASLDLPPVRTMPIGVASSMAYVMKALAAVRLMPNPPPLTPFAVKFLTAVRRYPNAALRRELDISPRVGARAGLDAALADIVSARRATTAALVA